MNIILIKALALYYTTIINTYKVISASSYHEYSPSKGLSWLYSICTTLSTLFYAVRGLVEWVISGFRFHFQVSGRANFESGLSRQRRLPPTP